MAANLNSVIEFMRKIISSAVNVFVPKDNDKSEPYGWGKIISILIPISIIVIIAALIL